VNANPGVCGTPGEEPYANVQRESVEKVAVIKYYKYRSVVDRVVFSGTSPESWVSLGHISATRWIIVLYLSRSFDEKERPFRSSIRSFKSFWIRCSSENLFSRRRILHQQALFLISTHLA
jgi:hypothetical protein